MFFPFRTDLGRTADRACTGVYRLLYCCFAFDFAKAAIPPLPRFISCSFGDDIARFILCGSDAEDVLRICPLQQQA